ncbi:MAG: polysaccharide biosynthesis/export family protein [Rhodobacteraceae bacterium]|nr:polysaccharide biosynthesis/export family protein [Paracoccaceae bacterium]
MKAGVRLAALFVVLVALGSCGLPRPGPNKREIFSSSVQREGNAFIVSVNERVIQYTSVAPAVMFSDRFTNAGKIGPDLIRPGDVLGLQIWENTSDTLLGGEATSNTQIQEIQVDSSGNIFVPYAGRIRAAGSTPDQLRAVITRKLDAQTPDPQVVVRRIAGDGSSVSVMGGVSAQGVYPIQGATRTLSAMLAKAGGIKIEPEVAQIRVTRGDQTGKVWFADLYNNPKSDIALRPGDRIYVEEDTRSYTALGATGAQTRIPFNSQKLSAVEALAQVGGLSSSTADPTGVFIFRDEPEEIANAVLGRNDLVGSQRFAYVLDMTEPNGVFIGRDFLIRDGDTVFVTEAPFVSWNKTLSVLNSGIATGANVAKVSGN